MAGRKSQFSGKKLVKATDSPSYREGSRGFLFWKGLKSGTAYDKFIENGGRRADVAYAVEHGFIRLDD